MWAGQAVRPPLRVMAIAAATDTTGVSPVRGHPKGVNTRRRAATSGAVVTAMVVVSLRFETRSTCPLLRCHPRDPASIRKQSVLRTRSDSSPNVLCTALR